MKVGHIRNIICLKPFSKEHVFWIVIIRPLLQDLIAHVLTTALRDPYLDDNSTVEQFLKYLNDLDTDYPDQETSG